MTAAERGGSTLVTGLFDLARREGSRRRTAAEYLELGELLFSLDQDIVFFVEPRLVEAVERRRRAHRLLHRSRIVPMPLEGLPGYRLLPRLRRALANNPLRGCAPRKYTAPYVLVTWSKLALLERVIGEDPFGSARFAWVDFGIANATTDGPRPEDRLFESLRPQVSLLMLRPFTRESLPTEPPARAFARAPEELAAGLISGDREHLRWLAGELDRRARAALQAGYAPTDEHLLPQIYLDAPERFAPFHGRYYDVLANCVRTRRLSNLPWQMWLCRQLGDCARGRAIGRGVLASLDEGTLEGSMADLAGLLDELLLAALHLGDRALAGEVVARHRGLVERDRAFAAAVAADRAQVDLMHGWVSAGGEVEEEDAGPPGPSICLVLVVGDDVGAAIQTLCSARAHVHEIVVVADGASEQARAALGRAIEQAGLDGRAQLVARAERDGGTRAAALALARERSRADYLWLLDAGDQIDVRAGATLGPLEADGYRVRVVTANVEQWCLQLLRRTASWEDAGVLHHPSVTLTGGDVGDLDPAIRIWSARLAETEAREACWGDVGGNDGGDDDGGANERALAEAARLERELDAAPDDPRRVFLLAQSLFGAGDHARALEQYRRRAVLGGCEHERFYARYRAGQCLLRFGLARWEEAQTEFLDAHLAHPSRAESLVRHSVCERTRGSQLAFRAAQVASTVPRPGRDALYVEPAVYDFRARDEHCISAYNLGYHADAFYFAAKLLWEDRVPEEERPRIEGNRDFAVPHLQDRFLRHDEQLVAELAERIGAGPSADPQVTLSVVTRGPLDDLYATLDSFLIACGDLEAIDRFICVDDCSSDEQRRAIAERYPFIEVVCKDRDDRGRAGTMNILAEIVQTPYWLSLEAGWLFFERLRYATLGRQILAADPKLGQVLFNRNYADSLADRALVGGVVRRTPDDRRYVEHEHLAGGSEELKRFWLRHPEGARANVWWPHYSLKPSLMRTAVVRAVGAHDEAQPGFELDFARRYAAAGYRSAFFDTICALRRPPSSA